MKSVKGTCIAAIAFVAALAIPAEAKIVYHKANINIQPNSSYNLDLNHDGVNDFTISTRLFLCNNASTFETPGSGNGVEGNLPAALNYGDQIGPSQTFYGGTGVMAFVEFRIDTHHFKCYFVTEGGNWLDVSGRYLGLMFQINGEIHYGWAQLSVGASTATLTGYAYETIPGTPINAGEIPPDFKITTSPTSAIVSPGQSTTSTLSLAPVFGFGGTVALTCAVPSGKGLSCEVSPSSVTLNGMNSATATLSINTSSSTPAGTYKINARGTSGTLTHWTTFTLTVQ